jgi:hypothetical protein
MQKIKKQMYTTIRNTRLAALVHWLCGFRIGPSINNSMCSTMHQFYNIHQYSTILLCCFAILQQERAKVKAAHDARCALIAQEIHELLLNAGSDKPLGTGTATTSSMCLRTFWV